LVDHLSKLKLSGKLAIYEKKTKKGDYQMGKAESEKVCEHPEKLKGKPGECSPEQIRECHGEDAKHPCVKAK